MSASVLDMIEADLEEMPYLHSFSIPTEDLHSLIAVARAAQKYRAVGLADPTSLDLPPAGADLDRAIRSLTRDSNA